jgi:1-acyl-sn-glycerol-3-phosphate acyltransferase
MDWKVGLRSVGIWTYIAASVAILTCVMAVLWLLTFWWDRRRRVCIAFGTLWANHYNALFPYWRITVEGREHLRPGGTYVFVANHQSLGDILVLYRIRRHFKWVSKQSVFRVPFLGWAMWMQGHVGVKRGHGPSIVQMMKECRVHLARGSSIMLFPEGTRSLDGCLQPFKLGAFTLAVEAGVPLVPLVVDGTRNMLPKRSFWFQNRVRQEVRIRVLPPITGTDSSELRLRVRERIAQELAELRGVAVAEVVQPES